MGIAFSRCLIEKAQTLHAFLLPLLPHLPHRRQNLDNLLKADVCHLFQVKGIPDLVEILQIQEHQKLGKALGQRKEIAVRSQHLRQMSPHFPLPLIKAHKKALYQKLRRFLAAGALIKPAVEQGAGRLFHGSSGNGGINQGRRYLFRPFIAPDFPNPVLIPAVYQIRSLFPSGKAAGQKLSPVKKTAHTQVLFLFKDLQNDLLFQTGMQLDAKSPALFLKV
ncbi:hypothetical protein IMSAGC007_03317 [Lachnospiraceae bacterium]|nr:hypothetical protein IMSAGC007_03317 [Lachnospiraceae bacterium]